MRSCCSPAGESPVRVNAKVPGSRCPASRGNARRRSGTSRAPEGGATARSVAYGESCRPVTAPPRRRNRWEPSRVCHGEGHGRGEELGDAASKNPPGYGEWNAQKVNSGTGETLPDPATAGAKHAITGEPREVRAGQEGGGWGRPTDHGRDNTTRSREGPLLGRRVNEGVGS